MDHTSHRLRRRTAYRGRLLWFSFLAPLVAVAGCPPDLQIRQTRRDFHTYSADVASVVSELTLEAGYAYSMMTKSSGPIPAVKNPIDGEMTLCEALAKALIDTGYDFTIGTDNRVIVSRTEGDDKRLAGNSSSSQKPVSVVRVADIHVEPEIQPPPDEVVVTGSYLRDVSYLAAQVIHIEGSELTQGSFATVQDALYELPLNSLNAPREDNVANGNYGAGAGANLRGLGTGATLVLLNGSRLASSGLAGEFTDLSQVPLSIVKRIEVLPDGSSAMYGSDAISGVVNIITDTAFEGLETQARMGGTPGGRDEVVFSQLAGKSWESGHVMLAYQFTDAADLQAAARSYAANENKTPYGGGDYQSVFSNPGNIVNPNTLLPEYGIPPGQNGKSLSSQSLSNAINLTNQAADYDLFPDRRTHSFYFFGSQRPVDSVELTLEGRYNIRDTTQQIVPRQETLVVPNTNPFFVDPFGSASKSVLVDYNLSRDVGEDIWSTTTRSYGAKLGATVAMPSDWRLRVTGSYGRETLTIIDTSFSQTALDQALADPDRATAFDPFGDGSYTNPVTLAGIRALDYQGSSASIFTAGAIADGSVVHLAREDVKLAVGVEHRRETFSKHYVAPSDVGAAATFAGDYGRNVDAAFGELSVPFTWEQGQAVRLVLSGRQERYSDFGTTTNGEARVAWTIVPTVKWRASWGTSFQAPTLDDMHDTSDNASGVAVLPDPKSPIGNSIILYMQGANPSLKPETAQTWTSGIDWVSDRLQGLTASLTYYSVDYKGQIAQPAAGNPFGILEDESEWAAVITRNPTPDQVAAICNRPDLTISKAACSTSKPAAIVDIRLANLGETRTDGLDIDIHQVINSPVGQWTASFRGTRILDFEQAASPSSSAVSVLDTLGNPISLKLRATLGWNQGRSGKTGFGAGLAFNYTGSYRNPTSARVPRVPALFTTDGQLRWRGTETNGWLNNVEFNLNVINLFNQSPPFVDWQEGYDSYSTQPLGRVLSMTLRKNW